MATSLYVDDNYVLPGYVSTGNNSATGGALTQTVGPGSDQSLRRFLQALLAGVSGLAGNLVRQNWARNPAPVPSIEVDWIGFGIVNVRPDVNPYMVQVSEGAARMQRHETFDVICMCYGDNCQDLAGQVRDGLYLSQNQESLMLAGMGFVECVGPVHVPELVNDRYQDRADLTITFAREIRREYAILAFTGASVPVTDDAVVPHSKTIIVTGP